jgi:hypothetical protein
MYFRLTLLRMVKLFWSHLVKWTGAEIVGKVTHRTVHGYCCRLSIHTHSLTRILFIVYHYLCCINSILCSFAPPGSCYVIPVSYCSFSVFSTADELCAPASVRTKAENVKKQLTYSPSTQFSCRLPHGQVSLLL